MSAKKRPRPWFTRALMNLATLAVLYKIARSFQKYALKQGINKKYKG